MEIQLTNCNLCATIDDEDLDKLLIHSYNWHGQFNKRGELVAVVAHSRIERKHLSMGNVILELYKKYKYLIVDHIDRNPLNNRKSNLRFCNRSRNNINRTKRLNTSSKYTGVSWKKDRNCWEIGIRCNDGSRIRKSGFIIEEEAAHAYNELAIKYHKEFAVLNIIKNINN